MSDEDEPFRYCVFCGADCEADEPEHTAECPQNTGVYPVTVQDLKPICPHCGESMYGPPRCMDCEQVLNVGDYYMHRVVDEGYPFLPGVMGAQVRELICIGCAAKDALAEP